ncbi:docking domain of Afi1 for Arf3 in vesicle trafficking-domain-containing protein [Chytridium lagenaria]|nr:docking domain of Afi1 for Arf3 in vesicle trafficking-domain-containing protein [Chytridium lagenaria]
MGSFIHVDHILVAEFDIDRGAQLTFQYPYDTGTDPHVLAELMLPDGAHLREEDWTMFFLNQRTPNQNDAVPTVQRQRRNQGADTSKNGNLTIDAHGYSYVQGSWRTISTKPRVSICLEEGQVTVWNGLMSQKLHEINLMSNAEYRQIEPLCLCVFFEGKTLAFRFENEDDEILLLNHLDVALYMSRKFTRGLVLPPPPPSETGGRPLLYVQNLVRTKQVPGARRGARVKAIAVASRHQWVYVFKPSLLVAMEEYFASDGDESIIANLYDSLNAMDISLMPRLTLAERNILRASEDRNMFDEKFLEMEERAYYRNIDDGGMRNSGSFTSTNKDRHFYETKIEYQGIRMPLRIPLAVFPEEIGDFSVIQLVTTFSALNAIAPPPGAGTLQWKNGAPYYWHFHLDSGPNTHPIVLLMNALLTQKRIVFLGHQRAAGDVANYVLAACAIASGGGALLKGFAERCFPYVSLAGLDNLLSVPGFIAGVTNPVFEEQTSWWDVLFNINTGRISVSSKIEVKDIRVMAENKDYSKDKSREWMKSGSWEGDDDFVGEVIFAIQAHMGELYVRQKFYDHVRRFVEVTAAFELESIGTTGIGMTPINTGNADLGVGAYFVDEATKRKEMLMLRNRMEGWRSTRSYLFYQKDFQNYLRRRPIKELDLRHAASRLRASSSLEESTVVQLFMTLQDNLVKQSDAGLIELLSLLPQNMGGLMPVATGMFHARWEVRRASTRILWRLDWHKVRILLL